MKELSESEEEYLEALYKLDRDGKRVRIGKLAEELKIKEPSVVEMLKKLEKKDLVNYERYKGASLTDEGKDEGRKVTRKHRLSERLLSDVLDRDLSQIHEEACKMEHSIADETANEIERFLENPETCPHGYPIPGKDEEVQFEELIKLNEAEEGGEYRVMTIPETSEYIQRLLPLAVLPGAKIELDDASSLGPIMVKKGKDKFALSKDIASKILVKPCERKRKRKRRGRSSR